MARAAVSTDLDALRRYAADHHGVVTGAAAAALGVRAVELLDLVLGGELALIANDVYRLYDVITPLTEYAGAVALAEPGAALADNAVLAMHDLASVNPRRNRVVVLRPLSDDVRLPVTVEVVVRELAPEDVTEVEGIPTMTVVAALRLPRTGRGPPGRGAAVSDPDGTRALARENLTGEKERLQP
jgi:predicted transcriptional regulator of viral defense system